MTLRITICGGGNAAHTLVGLLGSQDGLSVRIYVPMGDEAQRWNEGIKNNHGIIVKSPDKIYSGYPEAICRDPEDAVSNAQIVLLALPAFAHESILRQIAPFTKPGTWVGAIPARGGFDLCAREVFKEHFSDYIFFGFQTLPWACRIQTYGQQAVILGTKERVDLAVLPFDQSILLTSRLQELLGVKLNYCPNFLSLTLADTGQIIHPGIMYGLFHDWNGKPYPEHLLFYQSVDAKIAEILQQVSNEIQSLRAAIEERFPGLLLASVHPIKEWLQRSYNASIVDDKSLQSCFASNTSYAGLLAPMQKTTNGYIPDFTARYLSEDVPYNLLVTRGIAALACVPTPNIDQILAWAQIQLAKEFLLHGELRGKDLIHTRTPQRHGFTELDHLMSEMQYLPRINKGIH